MAAARIGPRVSRGRRSRRGSLTVADLNGDGKPDIIAVVRATPQRTDILETRVK